MAHQLYVIAHQGASAECPPNTLSAFRRAVEAGADIIELDVVLTLDGVPVVSHDLTVDACTDGHGLIPEMTLTTLKRLDAGSRFGQQFAGERIPTLAEILDWAEHNPIRLCLEIKGDTPERFIAVGRATVQLLQARDLLRPVTLTSFSPDCIRAMKALEPRLSCGFDPDEQRAYSGWELCAQALGCGANYLLHRHNTLTPEVVEEAHQHGIALWAWVANEPDEMRRALALGVDGLMTDRPALLRALLQEASHS